MLRDALKEMVAAYEEPGKEIPPGGNALIEQIESCRVPDGVTPRLRS